MTHRVLDTFDITRLGIHCREGSIKFSPVILDTEGGEFRGCDCSDIPLLLNGRAWKHCFCSASGVADCLVANDIREGHRVISTSGLRLILVLGH